MMTPLNEAAIARRGRPSRRRVGRVAAGVVFALTPWATLGIGTPVAFIAAAAVFSSWRRAHATALWISAAVYTAVLVAFVATDSGKPSNLITVAYVLISVFGGGAQALFTIWLARTGQTGPARHLMRRRGPATAITLRPARPRDARPGRGAVVTAIEYHVTVRYQSAGSGPVTFAWEGPDHPPPVGTRLRVYDLPAPEDD
jgi:predicted membrane metal-binding protein